MPNCTYCNRPIPRGTGKLFIRKTGKMIYLCSSKCDKNMNQLGRKQAKMKWITKLAINKGKELKVEKEIPEEKTKE